MMNGMVFGALKKKANSARRADAAVVEVFAKWRNKRHYKLLAPEFLAILREWLIDPRLIDRQVQRKTMKQIRQDGNAPC